MKRGNVTPGFDEAEYSKLIRAFPPRVIHDEAQLAATESEIDRLMAPEQRTPAQDAYLDLLSTLVEQWETTNVDVPALPAIEVVKFLCEMHGIPQRTLIPIFGTASIVSEVLAGKRELQRKHIAGLASYFNVSPAVFFADARQPSPPDGAREERVDGKRRLTTAIG